MVCTLSREALLAFIQPDMESIPKEFFKRVYVFALSYPGFSEQAIAVLEDVGCGRAGNGADTERGRSDPAGSIRTFRYKSSFERADGNTDRR